jgi:hypothetical protein
LAENIYKLFTNFVSLLFARQPFSSATHSLVSGLPHSGNMFGHNTASGQFPCSVAVIISCMCRPTSLSWGMEVLAPWPLLLLSGGLRLFFFSTL